MEKIAHPAHKTCSTSPNRLTFLLLVAGLVILLAIPCAALWLNWEWDPAFVRSVFLYPLSLVSETAGVVISLLFCVVLWFYLRPVPRKFLLLILILSVITVVGLGTKNAVKNSLQEPRPYVVWLEKNDYIPANQFYQLPHKSQFVSQQDLLNTPVPAWQQQYWAKNTGYSFPSGHAFFAAEWALVMLALLWRKKAYIPITLTMLWVMGVIVGRLSLGMHWPQDIIPSCLLAFVLVWLGSLAWNKWVLSPPQTLQSTASKMPPPKD